MSYKFYNPNDGTFSNEGLPEPEFINFKELGLHAVMLYSSASFIRNSMNTNPEINIPLGPDIAPGVIWFSNNIYLPDNILNHTNPINEVSYPNNKDARILTDLKFYHDILIQYKITKSDGTNFSNNRELRCLLVREDGVTPYDASIYANQQPDSGQHDFVLIKGSVEHNLSDLIRIKLNIVQDGLNSDQTDTKITIFRISWSIIGIKNE